PTGGVEEEHLPRLAAQGRAAAGDRQLLRREAQAADQCGAAAEVPGPARADAQAVHREDGQRGGAQGRRRGEAALGQAIGVKPCKPAAGKMSCGLVATAKHDWVVGSVAKVEIAIPIGTAPQARALRDVLWCLTGGAGWARVAPEKCPGVTAGLGKPMAN